MAIESIKDEKRLVEHTAAGDERAFAALFEGYYRQLGDFIVRLTNSTEIAEEIIQEVFVKIWIDREKLRNIRRFSDYLFVLCRNQALSYLRARARDFARIQTYARTATFEMETEEHEWTDKEQLFLLLEDAILHLPDQQRRVFRLSKLDRLSHADIAGQLGISLETVKKHMKLALKSIRVYVKKRSAHSLTFVMLCCLF